MHTGHQLRDPRKGGEESKSLLVSHRSFLEEGTSLVKDTWKNSTILLSFFLLSSTSSFSLLAKCQAFIKYVWAIFLTGCRLRENTNLEVTKSAAVEVLLRSAIEGVHLIFSFLLYPSSLSLSLFLPPLISCCSLSSSHCRVALCTQGQFLRSGRLSTVRYYSFVYCETERW